MKPLPRLRETPSQTAGPYVHIGLLPRVAGTRPAGVADFGAPVFSPDAPGARIIVTGIIRDGSGAPVTDAIVELWQADASGRYDDNGPRGWGRCATDAAGAYRFETIRPGRVAAADGILAAPHLTLWIVARGINVGLHTRLYFGDEAAANAADAVLAAIVDPRRRNTLVAARSGSAGMAVYTLDIHLQGDDETVFLDI